MKTPDPLTDARLFSHEAMHTTFTLRLIEPDMATAKSVARECFERIDLLEARLSRFLDGSDISRINRMDAGETLYLSDACHQCLMIALEAHARTGGLFDITLGRQIEHRKSGDASPAPPPSGSLIIHPDVAAVTCIEPGRELDLGGIGKGFALDQVRQLLDSWEMERALLAAGASSLLAIGPDAWPVDLAAENHSLRIALGNQALSASGTGIQGSHIIHPGGGEPSHACRRLWVVAADAATAEVWSTALILTAPEDIPGLIEEAPEIIAAYGLMEDGIRVFRG
jgi:FAD:protein FMN transferase